MPRNFGRTKQGHRKCASLIHHPVLFQAHFLQDGRKVMLDLDIRPGMVLFFTDDKVKFCEKAEALKDQILCAMEEAPAIEIIRRSVN